ncbi:MAG: hypothetical protein K9N23_01880 [Akkermansiaceae bacterium]|nr:hypothetical protein [Akkermansiaceae bacterium]MCF7730400.1 hypothetical protein [Akkermansiaceae bacterium]
MKTVADVNVLFATVVEGHAHHSTAWRWWEQVADHAESQGFRLTSFDADFRAFGLSRFEHLRP